MKYIRCTQLLLPPTLKVAKSDFEQELLSNLPMKEKLPLRYRTNFNHWQVAHRFAVQNLNLPPSMLVAKVTEYVFYLSNISQ